MWDVLCLTWFSASTKCPRPLRLLDRRSGYWQEDDSFLNFFFDKLHIAADAFSLLDYISSSGRTHMPPPVFCNTSFFEWWRGRSFCPGWRTLIKSLITVAKISEKVSRCYVSTFYKTGPWKSFFGDEKGNLVILILVRSPFGLFSASCW